MQYYGKAESAAARILEAFKSGDVPKALAPVFIRRRDDVPCRAWSWSNQLLVALNGHADARGFRQWERVGRKVRKGERAFYILVPLIGKREETDDAGQRIERRVLYGFKSAAVFGLAQTDGADLPGDPEADRWLANLPLRAVAESWGLSVSAYNGREHGAAGWYRPGQAIALGVENLATWAHELIHAADDRLGNLSERGQHWRSECVAELGGAILLECLGFEREADRGGCWEYVSKYAKAAGKPPIWACERVLKRTCDAVALILDTAEQLASESVSSVSDAA